MVSTRQRSPLGCADPIPLRLLGPDLQILVMTGPLDLLVESIPHAGLAGWTLPSTGLGSVFSVTCCFADSPRLAGSPWPAIPLIRSSPVCPDESTSRSLHRSRPDDAGPVSSLDVRTQGGLLSRSCSSLLLQLSQPIWNRVRWCHLGEVFVNYSLRSCAVIRAMCSVLSAGATAIRPAAYPLTSL